MSSFDLAHSCDAILQSFQQFCLFWLLYTTFWVSTRPCGSFSTVLTTQNKTDVYQTFDQDSYLSFA